MNIPIPFTPRALNLLGFVACVGLMAAALVLQYVEGLEPCPLCILQRVAVMLLGGVFLIAALHNPAATGRRLYAVACLLIAAVGAGVAGRHVWLQHLPPEEVPPCGPGMDYILETFPFSKALAIILRGSGDCAALDWTLLGLSIPGWTLVAFIGFCALALVLLVYRFPAPGGLRFGTRLR
ncbi:MAG: disulfide bond formation protein B [Gammaproteobacteria bacterium]|nr:disulfide bond formation protein B [Gammaproteobacteria bacterium]